MTTPIREGAGQRSYRPYTVPATNVSTPLQPGGALILGGWSFIETTGAAPAAAQLVDGAASGGSVIAEISLAAGATEYRCTPAGGIEVRSGLTLVVLSGNIRGSISVRQPHES